MCIPETGVADIDSRDDEVPFNTLLFPFVMICKNNFVKLSLFLCTIKSSLFNLGERNVFFLFNVYYKKRSF